MERQPKCAMLSIAQSLLRLRPDVAWASRIVPTSTAVPASIDTGGPRPDARERLGIEGNRPKPIRGEPSLPHRHLSLQQATVAHRRWSFMHQRAQAQRRALCSLARLLRRVKARHPQEQRSPAARQDSTAQQPRLRADVQRWGARRCAPRRHRQAVRRLAGVQSETVVAAGFFETGSVQTNTRRCSRPCGLGYARWQRVPHSRTRRAQSAVSASARSDGGCARGRRPRRHAGAFSYTPHSRGYYEY